VFRPPLPVVCHSRGPRFDGAYMSWGPVRDVSPVWPILEPWCVYVFAKPWKMLSKLSRSGRRGSLRVGLGPVWACCLGRGEVLDDRYVVLVKENLPSRDWKRVRV
jgi:hypothetical protein